MSEPAWIPWRTRDVEFWEPDKSPDMTGSERWTGVAYQDDVTFQDLVTVSRVREGWYLPGAWSETWGTYDGGTGWIHSETAYPLAQAKREAIRMYRAQRAYTDRARSKP